MLAATATTLADLCSLSYSQLDDLFRTLPAGDIPDGDSRGTTLFFPGTALQRPIAALVRWLAWQGKVFHAREGYLLNKILPFGVRAVRAKVYAAKSWFDGQDCIVLDYSKTSWLAWFVRDEIRQVGPGLLLGKVFVGKAQLIHFVIQFAA